MLLIAFLPTAVCAQFAEPFRNSSVSFGAGANYYSSGIGAGAEVAFDKWVLSTAAYRVQFEFNTSFGNASTQGHSFLYGHFDFLVDLFSAIQGRNPSDRLRSYLILGGGLVHGTLGDNDFCALLGLGGQYKFAQDWRLYAEIGAFVHPSSFDNNASSSVMAIGNVGLVYDIANNPTRSRSRFETQHFKNDWFFNIALGLGSINHGDITSFGERVSLLTPIVEFCLGKRLTTLWQIRLCASGLYARTVNEMFSFYNIRGDIMIDPVAYFITDNPHPQFSARPYLGVGIVSRLDDQADFLVAPAAGMQLVWRADPRNQIYLDARYVVTPPRFVQSEINQRVGSVGIVTLLLGYSHTFSPISFR